MVNYEQCYKESMEALTNYIEESKSIPTEKIWNQLAVKQNYLTSQSIGYLAGVKFPDLCKDIYKQNQKKRKEFKK